MKILVTGVAGFIGSELALSLAKRGDEIIGIDNINNYYDIQLKLARLAKNGIGIDNKEIRYNQKIQSKLYQNLFFIKLDISDKIALDKLFNIEQFEIVVNLAAQAGVRYSITNPYSYLESNIVGFLNILEACRSNSIKHLVYASSSSVYGMNEKVPYAENDIVTSPVSLYAASKKSNELMAHAYSKLYGFATTGLRFFTVYGPWGRPDMAPMIFANAISKGLPIKIFNKGNLKRDFTYIEDIIEGIIKAIDHCPIASECANHVAYKIYNIGCSQSIQLMDFIFEIEQALGKKANKEYLPMQQGDVFQTYADTTLLEKELGYKPKISLHEGIKQFIDWYENTYLKLSQYKRK